MEKLTYAQFCQKMAKYNETFKEGGKLLKGVIVFTPDSFDKPYPEISRSYETTNNQKAFKPNMISNSIWANCLDGTDHCVRLDYYIGVEWHVEYCYILES